MNFNIKIFLLCPIPEEQKPINEYINLQTNFLTSWLLLSKKNYQKKLFRTFCFFCLFFYVFQEKFFSSFFHQVLIASFESVFLLGFLFCIIFVRWQQIERKFSVSCLFYEEASWYDGQIWEKPFSILKNDRLLTTQKVRPLLLRNQSTFFILLIFLFILRNLILIF